MSNDEWETKTMVLSADANLNVGDLVTVERRIGQNTTISEEFVNVGLEASLTSARAERTYGDGLGEVALEGPKVGAEAGMKVGSDGVDIGVMAEASVCKAEGTLGPLYGSLGLNANTGVKLGTSGVQVNVFGFGFTLGVNKKFTLDTPFGSLGGAASSAVVTIPEERHVIKTREESDVIRTREERVLYSL